MRRTSILAVCLSTAPHCGVYTVRREGAIWHLLGCQILVQKTTPQMVPIGTLMWGCHRCHRGTLWGCRVAPSQKGATTYSLPGGLYAGLCPEFLVVLFTARVSLITVTLCSCKLRQ